jgi:hypothetical protein
MTRNTIIIGAIALGLFVTGALAQHEEHHQDSGAPAWDRADTGKTDGMTSGGMMSGKMMPQMMMDQNETGKLVDRLLESVASISAEKNPAARNRKLAEHRMQLKELQTRVQAQARMMEMMQHMMGGSTPDGMMPAGMKMGGDDTK